MFTLIMQNRIGGCCMPFGGDIARGNYYLNLAGMFAGLQNAMQQQQNNPVFMPAYPSYPAYPVYPMYQTNMYSTMPIFNSCMMQTPTLNMPVLSSCAGVGSYSPMMGLGGFGYPYVPTLSPITLSSFSYSNTQVTPQGVSSSGGGAYDKNALPQIKNSSLMKNVPAAKKEKILGYVDKACKQYDVDPKLVISMMYAESGFDENATSPCGAAGLMQLMPGTAKQYGASDPYNIEQNIFAAVKFLKYLKDRYNGNKDLMIAAYNAGPGRVKNSVPAIKETQNYVAKVNKAYNSLA